MLSYKNYRKAKSDALTANSYWPSAEFPASLRSMTALRRLQIAAQCFARYPRQSARRQDLLLGGACKTIKHVRHEPLGETSDKAPDEKFAVIQMSLGTGVFEEV